MHQQPIIKGSKNDGEDYFYRAIGPVLIVAEIFGLMPVSGIKNYELSSLKFKWTSLRTIITICNMLSGIFFGSVYFCEIWKTGITAKNIVGLVFFSCSSITFLLFLIMARKWPILMKHWVSLERNFLQPPYTIYGWTLRRRIRMAGFTVLSIALAEHLLYIISGLYNNYIYYTTCNVTVDDWWKFYFEQHFGFMFTVLPYHVITTLYLEYSNFAFTVAWNYMDLFIMLVSIGISTRFNQLNYRLHQMSNKVLPRKMWERLRCDYVLLCELVEYMDGHLAPIILLSCANNLYFICYQLLNIFNTLPHVTDKIYFWFSLLYLIGRTIFVYLCAASIHDASKQPLEIVRVLLSDGWCVELERFIEQVRSELTSLTGSKFFYMTRKLLFAIAGTVVTYELVLLQFNSYDSNGDANNSTNSSICHN